VPGSPSAGGFRARFADDPLSDPRSAPGLLLVALGGAPLAYLAVTLLGIFTCLLFTNWFPLPARATAGRSPNRSECGPNALTSLLPTGSAGYPPQR
jgi:hypothetical protein